MGTHGRHDNNSKETRIVLAQIAAVLLLLLLLEL